MENETTQQKALNFFKKADYENAAKEFLKLREELPNDVAVDNNIGLCYAKLGRPDDAEKFYLDALKKDCKSIQTYINLTDLYFARNDIAKCIGLLETAVTIMPENIVLMHYLARIYIEDVRYDEAFDILYKLTELSPSNIDAYWDLGNLSYETGDYENAVSCFEKVLEKRDDNPHIFFKTGLAYEAANDIPKALSNYLKAIAANNDFYPAYKKAAIMFLAQNDLEGAKEYFSDYLEFDLPEEEKSSVRKTLENLK